MAGAPKSLLDAAVPARPATTRRSRLDRAPVAVVRAALRTPVPGRPVRRLLLRAVARRAEAGRG